MYFHLEIGSDWVESLFWLRIVHEYQLLFFCNLFLYGRENLFTCIHSIRFHSVQLRLSINLSRLHTVVSHHSKLGHPHLYKYIFNVSPNPDGGQTQFGNVRNFEMLDRGTSVTVIFDKNI